jgi:O-antigen ligase
LIFTFLVLSSILLFGFYFRENIIYYYFYLIFVSVLFISIYFKAKFWWPLLALILPFSININIGNDSRILFPSEPIAALLAIYSILLIATGKIEKKYFLNSISLLFFAYFFWVVVTTFFSSNFIVSIKFVLVRTAYFFSFYIGSLYFFSSTKDKKLLPFFLYIISIAIVGTINLYNHSLLNFSKISSSYVTKPFYNDHTIFSACICMVLPFLFVSIFKNSSTNILSIKAIPRRALLLFLLIVLFFTYCRAAWISLLLSSFVGISVALNYLNFKKIVLLVVLIICVSYINFDSIINVFKENRNDSNAKNASIEQQAKSITNITTDKSNAERLNRWSCAIRMFSDRPIIGFGPGTYQFEYLKYQQKKEMTQISVTSQNNIKHGKGGTAHNEFLLALSETGFLGALFLFLIFSEILRLAIININLSLINKKLNVLVLISFLSFFIHSFFNNFLDTDKAAFLVFFLMAFIVHQNQENRMLTNG